MLVVFGSINVDLVFRVPRLPGPGETVLGPGYATIPGGKGANQAVAAALDGARVAMIGRVGRDAFAGLALDSLARAGVDIRGVAHDDAPTGCAVIAVDNAGENQIVVASGANARVAADQASDAMLGPDTTLVLQMECPAGENAALIGRARRRGARIVLNLAPASMLPGGVLRAVDILVVNRGEAAWLAREHGVCGGDERVMAVALALHLGVTVILTMGAEGALAAGSGAVWEIGALPVVPVDTTGAGDAFVGVLAASLDRGESIEDALHRAAVAAGLACETLGAQGSLAGSEAIDRALPRLAPPRRTPP